MIQSEILSRKIDRQMSIIAGMVCNLGLEGMKLTLVLRHPDVAGRFIIKTDDDLRKVAELVRGQVQS